MRATDRLTDAALYAILAIVAAGVACAAFRCAGWVNERTDKQQAARAAEGGEK